MSSTTSQHVHIKIYMGKEIRRFRLDRQLLYPSPPQLLFPQLISDHVMPLLDRKIIIDKKTNALLELTGVSVCYLDEENEWIRVDRDREWEECLDLYEDMGVNIVKLTVKGIFKKRGTLHTRDEEVEVVSREKKERKKSSKSDKKKVKHKRSKDAGLSSRSDRKNSRASYETLDLTEDRGDLSSTEGEDEEEVVAEVEECEPRTFEDLDDSEIMSASMTSMAESTDDSSFVFVNKDDGIYSSPEQSSPSKQPPPPPPQLQQQQPQQQQQQQQQASAANSIYPSTSECSNSSSTAAPLPILDLTKLESQSKMLQWNCNVCNVHITKKRFHCVECNDFDMCATCYEDKPHLCPGHIFQIYDGEGQSIGVTVQRQRPTMRPMNYYQPQQQQQQQQQGRTSSIAFPLSDPFSSDSQHLRLNGGGDVDEQQREMEINLKLLKELGLTDVEKNRELLVKAEGDIQRVVNQLLP